MGNGLWSGPIAEVWGGGECKVQGFGIICESDSERSGTNELRLTKWAPGENLLNCC